MTTDEIAQSLKNIEKHLEILVRFQYADKLGQALTNETEKKIFELTGEKGRDEICTELRVSSKTISDLWNKWLVLGILKKQGNSYKKTVE